MQYPILSTLSKLMGSTTAALLLIVTSIVLRAGADKSYPQERQPITEDASPLVCVIVRTYWGHGDGGSSDLKQLLQSLQNQKYRGYVLAARPQESP